MSQKLIKDFIKVGDFIKVENKSLKFPRGGKVIKILKDRGGCTYGIIDDYEYFTQWKFVIGVFTTENNPEYFV